MPVSCSIASCVGSTKHGSVVYVDFFKINRPCTCIVTPSFDGKLLVFSREEIILPGCNTQINFNNIFIIGCPLQSFLSNTLNVQTNQSVDVRAEYKLPFTPGTFYHCIGFQQNGGLNGNLSVVCGSSLVTTTAAATEPTTTTIKTTSTAISRLSSEVSSTEPTTAIIKNDVNGTESTVTTISKECIYGHKDEVSGESNLSLQIPLAIFVVISIVSTIMNICFYFHIKYRKSSGSKTSNVNIGLRTQTETTDENYTDLANTVPENQYDSLSGHDNYINTNVL